MMTGRLKGTGLRTDPERSISVFSRENNEHNDGDYQIRRLQMQKRICELTGTKSAREKFGAQIPAVFSK